MTVRIGNERVVTPIVACHNHPDRDAIGICVRCRVRVCPECTTKIDGINHCVTCLVSAAKSAAPERSEVRSEASGVLDVGAGAMLLALVAALMWALLEVTLPG